MFRPPVEWIDQQSFLITLRREENILGYCFSFIPIHPHRLGSAVSGLRIRVEMTRIQPSGNNRFDNKKKILTNPNKFDL